MLEARICQCVQKLSTKAVVDLKIGQRDIGRAPPATLVGYPKLIKFSPHELFLAFNIYLESSQYVPSMHFGMVI